MAFNKKILLILVLNITLCYSYQTENDMNITNNSVIGKESNMSNSSHSDCDDESKLTSLEKLLLKSLLIYILLLVIVELVDLFAVVGISPPGYGFTWIQRLLIAPHIYGMIQTRNQYNRSKRQVNDVEKGTTKQNEIKLDSSFINGKKISFILGADDSTENKTNTKF